MLRRLLISCVFLTACGRPAPRAVDPEPQAQPEPKPEASSPDAGVSDFAPLPTNVPNGALCTIAPGFVPANTHEATYIDCAIASDRFSDRDPNVAPDKLRVV